MQYHGTMTETENAGTNVLDPSPALAIYLAQGGISADDAEPDPVETAPPPPARADHIFPGEDPSERLYGRGCRCASCTGCHRDEARRRYHEHKDGTFVDRRKHVPVPGDPLAAAIAALEGQAPEFAAMLRKHLQTMPSSLEQSRDSRTADVRPSGHTPAVPVASGPFRATSAGFWSRQIERMH
jgi:hypothetical protein